MATGLAVIPLLLLLFGLSSAVRIDMCRAKPPVMQNFELLKIEGRWYEYARLPNLFQSFLNKERCNTQQMTVDGSGIRFTTTFLNETSGNRVTYDGTMSSNSEKPGKVLVKLSEVMNDYFSILDADYDDYVVFYSCDTLWYFRIEVAWVLTRKPTRSEEEKEKLMQRLKALKIDTNRLEFEDHNDC